MQLEPNEEREFLSWIQSLPWYGQFKTEYGEEPNVNDPQYDYRAAWKAGVVPTPDPYDNGRYHWDSRFKGAGHPTKWKGDYMDRTNRNPDADGVTKHLYDRLFGGQ